LREHLRDLFHLRRIDNIATPPTSASTRGAFIAIKEPPDNKV
jgi:hypothetical protein